jgi:DNA repair protein RecO (recombination protein O)
MVVMKNLLNTEGITLKSVNFRDYDRIITVFTYRFGLVKFIVRGGCRPKNNLHILTLPITRGDFIYSLGKNEIHKIHEGSLINAHLTIRRSGALLEAASQMIQLVWKYQLPEKPSPKLYELLLFCLGKLPFVKDPKVMVALFRLKQLKHDGLFVPSEKCSTCQREDDFMYMYECEFFCKEHAPLGSVILNQNELKTIFVLTHTKDMNHIKELEVESELQEKILILS